MTASEIGELTELDVRENDGIVVSLLWSKVENTVSVLVEDRTAGTAQLVPVPAARALDAFHHPFAYAGSESTGVLAA